MMLEERLDIGGVPARLYNPRLRAELLLLGHGGGHSKDAERFVQLSRGFAKETGLAVVCIDAVDHGDRRPASVEPGLPRQWHSRTIPRMVADWQSIAAALGHIGPPVGYVGFSMGSIFGLPTVAAIPSIAASVFVVGGIPDSGGIDDHPLRGVLLEAAGQLGGRQVLMLNKTDDEIFTREGVVALFEAIPGTAKHLRFSPGRHDDWDAELLSEAFEFLAQCLGQSPDRIS